MTEMVDKTDLDVSRKYWPKGLAAKIATGLCGLIAVFIAFKAANYQPVSASGLVFQDHLARILSFAGLTVWLAMAIGIRRRGAAAVITLLFAVYVELFIVSVQHDGLPALAAANLGIVLAYCGLQLYWFNLTKNRSHK